MTHDKRRAFRAQQMLNRAGYKFAIDGKQAITESVTDLLHLTVASGYSVQEVIGASLTDRTSAVTEAETSATFPVGRDEIPFMGMYTIKDEPGRGKRVIVFAGLLTGMTAAIDGTPAWHRAFALAKLLKIKPQAVHFYRGSVAEVEK